MILLLDILILCFKGSYFTLIFQQTSILLSHLKFRDGPWECRKVSLASCSNLLISVTRLISKTASETCPFCVLFASETRASCVCLASSLRPNCGRRASTVRAPCVHCAGAVHPPCGYCASAFRLRANRRSRIRTSSYIVRKSCFPNVKRGRQISVVVSGIIFVIYGKHKATTIASKTSRYSGLTSS